jgi:hypothetical protein
MTMKKRIKYYNNNLNHDTMKMTIHEVHAMLVKAAEKCKFDSPCDATQWAYNEGIEDVAIEFEQLIIKNK